jgi:hypothetical protein
MLEPAKHISSSFDAALYGLRNDVLIAETETSGQVRFFCLARLPRRLLGLFFADLHKPKSAFAKCRVEPAL